VFGLISGKPAHLFDLSILSTIFNLLNTLFDSVLAYNLLSLFSFAVTFLLSCYFFNKLVSAKHIAFLGAILITFSPFRLWQSFEWTGLAMWGYSLSYVYLLLTVFSRKQLSYSLLLFSGLFYGLAFDAHIYYGFVLFSITFLFLLVFLLESLFLNPRIVTNLKKVVLFGMFSFLFSIPSLYLIFIPQDTSSDNYVNIVNITRSPHDRWAYSARPWHYLIPDINHPVLGDFAIKTHYKLWNSTPYYLTEPFFPKEHTLYLGYTLMFLSLISIYVYLIKPLISKNYELLKTKKSFYTRYFFLIGLTAFIFSMPPYITYNSLKIYFPSYFIYDFLPQFRAYARFGALVIISNVFLGMLGLDYLLRKFGGKKRVLLLTLFSFLAIFEYINFPPFHNYNLTLPPAYKFLQEQKGDFSYLEIPVQKNYSDLFYASKHNKTPLNPYYRTPSDVPDVKNVKGPNSLFADGTICYLNKKYKLRYIFYHRKIEIPIKQRLAESWGFPAWGTHADIQEDVDSAEKDFILMESRLAKLKNLLKEKTIDNIAIFKVVNCD